jgi:methanogenic corrinoid protein MtbC1
MEDRLARGNGAPASTSQRTDRNGGESIVRECLSAAEALDAPALRRALSSASIGMSQVAVIDQILIPLMFEIGERWRAGTLRIAHEHLASAAVQAFLSDFSKVQIRPNAPTVVVATPQGQRHQIGAMMVASTAISEGWNVVYLGADIPLAEVASVCAQVRAAALALSITYPGDDPYLERELAELRQYVPDTSILVGGQSAEAYSGVFAESNATFVADLTVFRRKLEDLRHAPPRSPAIDRG